MHYTTSCNTQSSALEDGRDHGPKHVEQIGIINKPLLLHLVDCLYYVYQGCTVKQTSVNETYLMIKYIKSVLWRVAKRLSYIEDARYLKRKGTRKLQCCCATRAFFFQTGSNPCDLLPFQNSSQVPTEFLKLPYNALQGRYRPKPTLCGQSVHSS